jgi:antitoxin MazE
METKLIKIGNSFGIRIPKSLIQQYDLSNSIEIDPTEKGILIKPKKGSREGWEEQFAAAIKENSQPEGELLEGFTDEFTEEEWQW